MFSLARQPPLRKRGLGTRLGYVYCIAEYEDRKETGYFKVGMTKDPDKRLRDLQTGNVRQLKYCKKEVLKRLNAEKAAHEALKKYKVDLGGGTEWFKVPQNERDKFYRLFCEATKQ